MNIYKKDGYWHVIKNGLLLGRGRSLATVKEILREHWN